MEGGRPRPPRWRWEGSGLLSPVHGVGEEDLDVCFFDPEADIDRTEHRLPHWHQGMVYASVTWRLGDALPAETVDRIESERRLWLLTHPRPWQHDAAVEHAKLFSLKIDELLDAGAGSCILRDPGAARCVVDALRHFDEQRYRLDTFVIMPNHVHVLFQLYDAFPLPKVVQAWKSFSSRQLTKLAGVPPPIWQAEYFDRLIRSGRHLERARSYIAENPVKARLSPGSFLFWSRQGSE